MVSVLAWQVLSMLSGGQVGVQAKFDSPAGSVCALALHDLPAYLAG